MMEYNKVIMIARLTQDPEVRYLQSGSAVCSFNVASNNKYKKGDEWIEEVTYIKVNVFGKVAENCGKYLSKGSQALIEGRLKEEKWDDKETQKKRSKHVIIAQSIQFMDKSKQSVPSELPPEEVTDIEPF